MNKSYYFILNHTVSPQILMCWLCAESKGMQEICKVLPCSVNSLDMICSLGLCAIVESDPDFRGFRNFLLVQHMS